MKSVLKWIFGILGGLIIFGVISSYYSPDNTEMLTETPEQAAMDEKKLISTRGVADCLSNKYGVITPDTDYLYSLNKMVAFQSLPDGLLIQIARNLDEPQLVLTDVAFLKTDRDFADGAMLNGYLAAYKGTYEYTTTDERRKKVLAFKLVKKTLQTNSNR